MWLCARAEEGRILAIICLYVINRHNNAHSTGFQDSF